jgi:hypothetical protein
MQLFRIDEMNMRRMEPPPAWCRRLDRLPAGVLAPNPKLISTTNLPISPLFKLSK